MTSRRGSIRVATDLGRLSADGIVRDLRAGVRRRVAAARGDVGGGAQVTDLDPFAPEVAADPYPAYSALLTGARVHYNRRRGIWILSRYEDVRAAAKAHGALSSGEGVAYVRRRLPMLLGTDRPEHTRLRRILARHFTREAIEARRPSIEEIVTGGLERLFGNPAAVDAAAEFAAPVPIEVIAELLGIPRADRPRFRSWSNDLVAGFDMAPGAQMRNGLRALRASWRLRRYFLAAFAERRSRSSDDLLGHLLESSEDGALSPDELSWFALLLLVAGNETTANLLGSMLLTLAEHPSAFARVREQPGALTAAVEEVLRLHSPIQGLYRTAVTAYHVGHVTIPPGGRVLLLFAAANRDPRKYDQPERFCLGRDTSEHLAFGSGIHFCLGAHLARLEASIALRHLVERACTIRLAGPPTWGSSATLRGLHRLPLRLEPRRGDCASP